MRIAVFCPYSLSVPGGVQGQALGQAAELHRMGHHAVVIGPSDGPVIPTSQAPSDVVAVGRSIGIKANGSVAPLCLSPSAMSRALKVVRGGHFDIVHLHEPLAPGPHYGPLARAAQPKVATFHRQGSSVAYRLLRPLGTAALRRIDARFAVSEEARRTVASAFGGSYQILGNGVDLAPVEGAEPCHSDDPTIFFVGRHEQRKGLADLLDAHQQVVDRAKVATPVLWIAGIGPDTTSLRMQYPEHRWRRWLGRIDDDEKYRRLKGAAITCAPSLRGESFGVVLVEAMLARAVVVASNIPGYSAVVDGHGLLYPPGDSQRLADVLEGAVQAFTDQSGPASGTSLAAAYQHATKWSMTNLATSYLAVYHRLLGTTGSSDLVSQGEVPQEEGRDPPKGS